MFEVITQGILEASTTSFLAGLIIVAVIKWAISTYMVKKNGEPA